jgi:hypothetical protein
MLIQIILNLGNSLARGHKYYNINENDLIAGEWLIDYGEILITSIYSHCSINVY